MKFLIIGLIFLSTYVLLTESATPQEIREQLLRRANYVITLVEGEVKLLRFENHNLQADGLEAELEQLLTIALELRATEIGNVTDAYVSRLDTRLAEIETRIQTQLRALGRQYVTRREIEELLRRTRELINMVSAEVKVLRAAGRNVSALGLEVEEERLIQLEVNIRSTQRSSEIRMYEELLVEADYRVWEILNGLGATRRKRALKEDVLMRAEELVNITNAAIATLQARGNATNSVQLLQRAERQLQQIATNLKAATNESQIIALEEQLIAQEWELSRDLSRLGMPISVQERRNLQVTQAVALQQRVNLTIADLTKQGRTQDIALLQRELANVTALITQLQAATTDAQLTAIEQQVRDAEMRLFDELTRLNRNPADPREVRRVINRAEELASRVVAEIRELVRTNRSLEAEALRAQEQELIRLDVELRDAMTTADLVRIEQRLINLEDRVAAELRRLGGFRFKRDLKDDVLKRAEELVVVVDAAIKDFTAQGNRTQAVSLLQRHERDLQQAVTELKAAATTNATLIGILEGRVIRIEMELVDDLRRFGRPIDVNERKDLLITRAEGLNQWANARIAQLRAQNRTQAIERVLAEERTINALVAQLKNATTAADLNRLERELDNAEDRFAQELRALGEPVIAFEELQALLRRAEDLAVQIIVQIRALQNAGRTLLVEGLREEERQLIHLDAELRVATTPQQIANLETRLKAAEDRVDAELRRIAGN